VVNLQAIAARIKPPPQRTGDTGHAFRPTQTPTPVRPDAPGRDGPVIDTGGERAMRVRVSATAMAPLGGVNAIVQQGQAALQGLNPAHQGPVPGPEVGGAAGGALGGGGPGSITQQVQSMVDLLATVAGGGDPDAVANLTNQFMTLFQGAGSEQQVAKGLQGLFSALNLSPEKVEQALASLVQKGAISPERYNELMESLQMLLDWMRKVDQQQGPARDQGAGAPVGDAPIQPGRAGGAGGGGGPQGPSVNVDGAGGFLFKPVSESDGKLVVLLPTELRGNVDSVVIRDNAGTVIDQGRFAGDDANGGRAHFRFGRTGADYPPDVTVEIRLKDGSTKSYPIGDPSVRHD